MNKALERYSDLYQEMSNKVNQLFTDINSMDLDSANDHLNKINAEAKVIPGFDNSHTCCTYILISFKDIRMVVAMHTLPSMHFSKKATLTS